MKFIINIFLLFFSLKSFALIRIEYTQDKQHNANLVKNILMEKYLVPEGLIDLKPVNTCLDHTNLDLILDTCINEKGELLILSYNEVMLKKSFKIFKETF